MQRTTGLNRCRRLAQAAFVGVGMMGALAAGQDSGRGEVQVAPSALTLRETSAVAADEPPVASSGPFSIGDDSEIITIGDFSRRVTILPHGLLWQPPLTSPNEPRSYMKIMSLSEPDMNSVNDCSIGGTLPLIRFAHLDNPNQGFQTDIFATVMSRFVERRIFAAVDYRFGVPFTYSIGKWSFKGAYEHTSCHLGDEFLIRHDLPSKDSTRNEAVFGVAYRPIDPLRLYGQVGYAVSESSFIQGFDRWRYTCGAEWSRPGPTGTHGQPYAAFDLEFRGDEDYTPNLTTQVGWQWLGVQSAPDFRVALEYYDGRSPFGQFIDRHESWVSLGFYFDF